MYLHLVVGAWGDPWNWGLVSYVSPDGRERLVSRTSLELVAKMNPGATVLVVVQETLLASNRARRRNGACSPVERPYPDPECVAERCWGYADALGQLAGGVREWAKANAPGLAEDSSGLVVGVAPGLGEFSYLREDCSRGRSSWRLSSGVAESGVDMLSFYQSVALLLVLREMLRLAVREGACGLEVHLDLTHGVNYTPTAMYRAVLYASRVYAALTGENVVVNVYNSEPYTPGAGALRVWRVRRETVTPKKALSRLYYAYSLAGAGMYKSSTGVLAVGGSGELKKRVNIEYTRRIGNETRGLQSVAQYAGAAAFYGLPLLLLQAGYDTGLDDAVEAVKKTLGVVEALLGLYPRVDCLLDGGAVFEHLVAPLLPGVKGLLALLAMASYASNAWRASGAPRPVQGGPGVAATMGQLEEAARWTAGPFKPIVENELSKLKRAQGSPAPTAPRNEELEHWLSHAAHLCPTKKNGYPVWRLEKRKPGVDKRILVAHSGFNKDSVEIVCLGGEPALRYRGDALGEVRERAAKLSEDLKKMLE